jgi:hypothetical protein
MCDVISHKCVSLERNIKGKILGEENEKEESGEDTRRLQIKNIVIIACIVAFIGMAAVFVKCVQKQNSHEEFPRREGDRTVYEKLDRDTLVN